MQRLLQQNLLVIDVEGQVVITLTGVGSTYVSQLLYDL